MTGPRYSQAGVQALKQGVAAYRSGDRIVPARQAERLLEAVEAVPPAHDCPALGEIRYATSRARAEQLAAIQDGGAGR